MNNCQGCGIDFAETDSVKIEETRTYSGNYESDKDRIEYGTDGADSTYIIALCATCGEELPLVVYATMSLGLKKEGHE